MADFVVQYMDVFHDKTPPSDQVFASRGYYCGMGDTIKQLKLLSPEDRLKMLEEWEEEYDVWLEEQLEKPDIGWNASQQNPASQ